ncbi:Ldh family oxidoreductase [Belnapia sp. T18]|uniref:Ldh family oxidoreductase n=1 Tax=Belnapia arida TaxID=2804533 RepID=A0ABS1U280_9PROT|nr:Ldh family oxidoreductase [Belnapia arida]MBL6078630.1 Ldh family oxidoreductase [Belnapia arida]
MPDHIPAEALRRFMTGIYEAAGVPAADAALVAGLMTEADLIGADGHGVFRLAQYVRRMRAGGMNPRATPRIVEERPASALIDGDNGLGHLATTMAAHTAIAKARSQGVAWCGVRHGNHAGPASLYARMVMEAGMIGLYLAVGSANHLPPWGGLELLLSTNPIAVAVPAGEEPPIILDMATTVAAYGKVKVKAQRGEPMPEGWMIDKQGQPLTDPKRAGEGLLLPIGGYKGYGLALIFGLLAGTLNGAAMGRDVVDFNADDTTVTNTGQAILAIDLAAFGDPGEFRRRVDGLAREIRGSARLPGVDRIFLPGEQSAATRARRAAEGVPIPPPLRTQLDTLADELGAPRLGA